MQHARILPPGVRSARSTDIPLSDATERLDALSGLPAPYFAYAPAMIDLAYRDRGTLEALIGIAIDLLDAIDGDADLELAGDETDGVGAEDEECAWFAIDDAGPGDPDDAEGVQVYPTHPAYGVDQSEGPNNRKAADRAWYRAMYARDQRLPALRPIYT